MFDVKFDSASLKMFVCCCLLFLGQNNINHLDITLHFFPPMPSQMQNTDQYR